jgi:hypothetical protein
MFDFRQKAIRVLTDRLGLQSRAIPAISVPFQRRNSLWQQVPGAEITKFVQGLAVANAGTVTVWIPGAGLVIYLTMLTFSTSVAGKISVIYNGVTIINGLALAGTTYIVTPSGGMYLYPAAQSLTIQNNTGGAADIYGSAWGSEVAA